MIGFWIRASRAFRCIGSVGLGWATWWGRRATNADGRVYALSRRLGISTARMNLNSKGTTDGP